MRELHAYEILSVLRDAALPVHARATYAATRLDRAVHRLPDQATSAQRAMHLGDPHLWPRLSHSWQAGHT